MEQSVGFLSSLFDFSFTSFITTKLIKVLYALAILGAALAGLGFFLLAVVSGFKESALAGLGALVIGGIVAALVFFLWVLYARVLLEIIIVIFRMSEHLAEIARQGRTSA